MGIEVLIPGDKPCWEFSRVEATEDGRYFIVGHGDLEMAGLQTRYRVICDWITGRKIAEKYLIGIQSEAYKKTQTNCLIL